MVDPPDRAPLRRRPRRGRARGLPPAATATSPSSSSTAPIPGCSSGARLQCPLVVGVGEGETFLASSIAAFQRETNRVQLIEDGEVVAITPEGARFVSVEDGERQRDELVIDWDDEAAERHGFETFMLKEIYEQPSAVGRTIEAHVEGDEIRLDGLELSDEELAAISADPRARVRHGLPRGRRRALRGRGVGARSLRVRRLERVALPEPGAPRGHARDRDLPVRRDARHGARAAARARPRRPDARDHEPPRHPDHARGRQRPLHPRRHGDGRRGVEDLHRAGRRSSSCSR